MACHLKAFEKFSLSSIDSKILLNNVQINSGPFRLQTVSYTSIITGDLVCLTGLEW